MVTLNWTKTTDGKYIAGDYLLEKTPGKRWLVLFRGERINATQFTKLGDAQEFAQKHSGVEPDQVMTPDGEVHVVDEAVLARKEYDILAEAEKIAAELRERPRAEVEAEFGDLILGGGDESATVRLSTDAPVQSPTDDPPTPADSPDGDDDMPDDNDQTPLVVPGDDAPDPDFRAAAEVEATTPITVGGWSSSPVSRVEQDNGTTPTNPAPGVSDNGESSCSPPASPEELAARRREIEMAVLNQGPGWGMDPRQLDRDDLREMVPRLSDYEPALVPKAARIATQKWRRKNMGM